MDNSNFLSKVNLPDPLTFLTDTEKKQLYTGWRSSAPKYYILTPHEFRMTYYKLHKKYPDVPPTRIWMTPGMYLYSFNNDPEIRDSFYKDIKVTGRALILIREPKTVPVHNKNKKFQDAVKLLSRLKSKNIDVFYFGCCGFSDTQDITYPYYFSSWTRGVAEADYITEEKKYLIGDRTVPSDYKAFAKLRTLFTKRYINFVRSLKGLPVVFLVDKVYYGIFRFVAKVISSKCKNVFMMYQRLHVKGRRGSNSVTLYYEWITDIIKFLEPFNIRLTKDGYIL